LYAAVDIDTPRIRQLDRKHQALFNAILEQQLQSFNTLHAALLDKDDITLDEAGALMVRHAVALVVSLCAPLEIDRATFGQLLEDWGSHVQAGG
jgi:hypothetical protein